MKTVRLTQETVAMEHHSQDPFNPHPVFPQWSAHNVYPYPFWGSMFRRPKMQKYFMPALENEYLKVTVTPDIGGRIWDVYDKIGKRHLANYNVGVRSYNAGFGLNYTTGGLEVNYPLAHSCTTNTLREYRFQKGADGAQEIVISEYDRIWRTRWSVAYVLYPGRSYIEQRVRLYNRTPHDSRGMYWNNCGFVLNKDSQFIFPEDEGAMHGQEHSTFSWPLWRHRDMSLFRQVPAQMLGLYYLNARQPFFGYYQHDEQFGLCHYADLADVPGKKYWTWGTEPKMLAAYRKTHHTLDQVYGEVQSGRIVIQEHLDRMPPETECEWTERWFPVRDTGAFNGAGPGAALRAEVIESSAKTTRLRVALMGNASYPNARLLVTSDGIAPIEQPLPFDPKKAVERLIDIPAKAGPDQHTAVTVLDRWAGVLARCALRHPNTRDCWKEVLQVRPELKPVGVEEIFRAAEIKARDWGNHDLKAHYEKAIAVDSGFSPARRELGKLAVWQGLYEDAVGHFEIARRRDEDSLELRYFLGIALRRVGRTEDARQAFELAARYDWEARALARLAEMRMVDKDWPHALLHLDRIAAVHPRLTRCRGLRAICYRKLDRPAEAAAELAAARAIDPQDPFLQFEEMFTASGGAEASRLPARPLQALIEQVRGAEPPLFEAAFDYFNTDLLFEAEAVLRTIPSPGPLANFLLAYVVETLGRQKEALQLLRAACRQDPAYQHAWALELIPVLEWAGRRLPKEPRPLWHLGNLYMARRRAEDGAALWRRAEELGERHYLLFSNIAFYEENVTRRPERALDYFRKADALSGGDLYVKHQIQKILRHWGKTDEAIRYLEGQKQAVLASPQVAWDLLNGYLDTHQFRKFDAMIPQFSFSANWQIPGPHRLWFRRQMMEAILLKHAGKLRESLSILLNVKPVPPNLGMLSSDDTEDDRRYYHIGCIHEKLGERDEARTWWEKACALPYFSGYEPACNMSNWARRYYHALCLQKLGREAEASAYFDAMELLSESQDLGPGARRHLLDLVERGRFGSEEEKDPAASAIIEVATRAEA